MNKRYLLATAPVKGVGAAVFATGVESPIESLRELEQELAQCKVVGTVLFDVLLSQGTKANRYFLGDFDGKHLDTKNIRPAGGTSGEYSSLSACFLKEHFSDIDPSLLTRAMQYALKKGLQL